MSGVGSPWVTLSCGTHIDPKQVIAEHIANHRATCTTCIPLTGHPDLGQGWTV